MSKTLLVLAASTYQIPTIKAAKRLGYRVITTDNVPLNPGHQLADAAFSIDTQNVGAILALAKRENVAGVIASATDVAVETAAHVSQSMNLPGVSPQAARILTHKAEFRAFQKANKLDCPRQVVLGSRLSQPPDELWGGGQRWILKPARSSGSKGIFVICSAAELLERREETHRFSLGGVAVLEEFLTGTQHTCEGLLVHGRVALRLVTDRDTAKPPYTATIGHRVPSRLPSEMQISAIREIERICALLRVVDGPFDCDFLVERKRVVVIEMTPRLGGNSLTSLVSAALNFDLAAYAVTHACSDPYTIPKEREPDPFGIVILGSERAGRLRWNAKQASALQAQSWLPRLEFDGPQGTNVGRFINGRHRVGEALVRATDREELDARIAELHTRLELTAE